MTRKRILSILLLTLATAGVAVGRRAQARMTSEPQQQPADFVIRAGAIHTMTQSRTTMHSIAIGGGAVLAVATRRTILMALSGAGPKSLTIPP